MTIATMSIDRFEAVHREATGLVEAVFRLQTAAMQHPELRTKGPEVWQFIGALVYAVTHGTLAARLDAFAEATPTLENLFPWGAPCSEEAYLARKQCRALSESEEDLLELAVQGNYADLPRSG